MVGGEGEPARFLSQRRKSGSPRASRSDLEVGAYDKVGGDEEVHEEDNEVGGDDKVHEGDGVVSPT